MLPHAFLSTAVFSRIHVECLQMAAQMAAAHMHLKADVKTEDGAAPASPPGAGALVPAAEGAAKPAAKPAPPPVELPSQVYMWSIAVLCGFNQTRPLSFGFSGEVIRGECRPGMHATACNTCSCVSIVVLCACVACARSMQYGACARIMPVSSHGGMLLHSLQDLSARCTVGQVAVHFTSAYKLQWASGGCGGAAEVVDWEHVPSSSGRRREEQQWE